MSEESMARLGLAFLFLGLGASIEEAAALAFDDDLRPAFSALLERDEDPN